MEIKKKHHYVSQFYLKRWANSVNMIYVNRENKSFSSNINNIGFENYFYKITRLQKHQRERLLGLHDMNLPFKESLEELFKLEDMHILGEKLIDYSKKKGVSAKESEIYYKINLFVSNILEEKYSIEESVFADFLRKLDNSLRLTLKDYDVLLTFVFSQLVRTPKKRESILLNYEKNKKIRDEFSYPEYKTFVIYSCILFSEEISISLMSNLVKIFIYKNKTDVNFITSDDPCFNASTEKIKIFFPLSPLTMLVIEPYPRSSEEKKSTLEIFSTKKEKRDTVFLSEYDLLEISEIKDRQEIIEFNKITAGNSYKQIFAKERDDFTGLFD